MIEDEEDSQMVRDMLEDARDLFRLGLMDEESMEQMEDLANPNRKAARVERAELEAETRSLPPSSQKQARL